MKKIIFTFLLFCTIGLIFLKYDFFKKTGRIILLNGPSTAGKSSLKKALQQKLSTPYLNLGIDTLFIGVLPERFVTGPAEPHDIDHAEIMAGAVSFDNKGNRIFTLTIGEQGDKIIYGMHRAIAAYAKEGNNCIVDYITYKDEWIENLCDQLKELTVYTVGIDLPLETLEEREQNRNIPAIIGHARSHWKSVHTLFKKKNGYDLILNDEKLSPHQAAQQILDHMNKDPHPKGFLNLSKKDSFSKILQQIKSKITTSIKR